MSLLFAAVVCCSNHKLNISLLCRWEHFSFDWSGLNEMPWRERTDSVFIQCENSVGEIGSSLPEDSLKMTSAIGRASLQQRFRSHWLTCLLTSHPAPWVGVHMARKITWSCVWKESVVSARSECQNIIFIRHIPGLWGGWNYFPFSVEVLSTFWTMDNTFLNDYKSVSLARDETFPKSCGFISYIHPVRSP